MIAGKKRKNARKEWTKKKKLLQLLIFGQLKFVNSSYMENQVLRKMIEEKMFPESKDQNTTAGRNASAYFKAYIYSDLKRCIKSTACSRRNTVRIAVEKKVMGKERKSE